MNGYATARQNGWMSANDIRELENMDRIPAEDGGDLYLINGNMLPLGNAGAFADTQPNDDGKEENPDEEVLEVEEPELEITLDEMIRTNDVIRDEAEDREAIYLPPILFFRKWLCKEAASVDVLWKEEI